MMENLKKIKLFYIIGIYINIIRLNYIKDSLRLVRIYLIRNKWLNKGKFEKIEPFKNKHEGMRCFIIGTAPSLTINDLELLQNEITFSVNSVIKLYNKTKWRPTYYGIQDRHVYKSLENDIKNTSIPIGFVSDYIYNKYESAKSFIPYYLYDCRHGSHGQKVALSSGFSNDVSEVVYDGYSVVHSMLQIAVYMGFKEIFLLGCDCSYDKSGKHHIVESGFFDKQSATAGERMIFAHGVAKEFIDKHGIKVYNATRGGMLEVYQRVRLEDILIQKNK